MKAKLGGALAAFGLFLVMFISLYCIDKFPAGHNADTFGFMIHGIATAWIVLSGGFIAWALIAYKDS